jgi:hypothetical protein
MNHQTYICPSCNKEATIPQGGPVPVCCGRPMVVEPLPACTKAPADPEMARSGDADEPCDDGTRRKKG